MENNSTTPSRSGRLAPLSATRLPETIWSSNRWPPSTVRVVNCVLLSVMASALLLAILLMTGRFWSDPLRVINKTSACAATTMILVAIAIARILWLQINARHATARSLLPFLLIGSFAVTLIAIVMWMAALPAMTLLGVWIVAAAAEAGVWYTWRRQSLAVAAQSAVAVAPETVAVRTSVLEISIDDVEEEIEEPSPTLADGVTQQLTRMTNESGLEVIYGITRSEFAENERQKYIHIAFCPPLNKRPQITVNVIDGAEARIKIVSNQTYGVCFEIKLARTPATASQLQVEFFATETESESWAG